MRKLTVALMSLALSVSLSGCGNANGQAQAYGDIEELKLAFEDAGGLCLEWNQDNQVSGALQSGTCNSSTVLMFFGSPEDAKDRALDLKTSLKSFGLTPSLLLGENWLINSPDVQIVEPQLGGLLIVD
jgi:hypothetical protein